MQNRKNTIDCKDRITPQLKCFRSTYYQTDQPEWGTPGHTTYIQSEEKTKLLPFEMVPHRDIPSLKNFTELVPFKVYSDPSTIRKGKENYEHKILKDPVGRDINDACEKQCSKIFSTTENEVLVPDNSGVRVIFPRGCSPSHRYQIQYKVC